MKWLGAFILSLSIGLPSAATGKTKDPNRPRPDQEVRTVLRKKAPFWLQDSTFQVLLQKDGTFVIDKGSGTLVRGGRWSVEKSQLKLKWNSNEEEKVFPVQIVDHAPVIAGAPLNKGRFRIAQ